MTFVVSNVGNADAAKEVVIDLMESNEASVSGDTRDGLASVVLG